MADAQALAQSLAHDEPLPDGGVVRSLDEAGLRRLAADSGTTLRQASRTALRAGIWPRRYLRNSGKTPRDLQHQLALVEARAAQVGLGGLGGHLLELLARQGVGGLRAADGDIFEEHNLNRQLLATAQTVGQPKAQAAAQRIAQVNPAVELETLQAFLNESDLPEFLSGCHVVLDALGGLASRQALQRAASRAQLPLVTGAMAGNTGYVAVVLPGTPGPADFLGQGAAAEDTLGTPPASVAVVAALMAREAVRLITCGTSPLAGAMLLIDLETPGFERVEL